MSNTFQRDFYSLDPFKQDAAVLLEDGRIARVVLHVTDIGTANAPFILGLVGWQ